MEEKKNNQGFPLTKKNYILLAIGFIIVIIGFILMSGGKSPNPNVFSQNIFSFRRIILAPIVIVFGYMFEIYAIMHRPKKEN
jgi:membrane-bound ClpP family serine protease